MIIGQMYTCGIMMNTNAEKVKPIALKSKAWASDHDQYIAIVDN